MVWITDDGKVSLPGDDNGCVDIELVPELIKALTELQAEQ